MASRLQWVTAILTGVLLVLSGWMLMQSQRLLAAATESPTPAPTSDPAVAGTHANQSVESPALGDCHVGVWLQAPENAQAWKDLGVQCYFGLWNPLNDESIAALDAADMPVVTGAEEALMSGAAQAAGRSLVAGWLTPTHEPDLSQDGSGGPAVPPETVIQEAQAIKAKDPSRPVMVYLSPGVAIPQWYGMGSDSRRWEEYYKQIVADPAIDAIAFDYYPWNTDAVAAGSGLVEGDPKYVVDGLKRLREWSGGKPVYPTIAASQVSTKFQVPSAEQTSSLVTQLLDEGAAGIIWFAHDFAPDGQYIRDAHPLQVTDGSADMVRTVNDLVKKRLD